MAKQLLKRLTKQWVEQVLKQFNEQTITEKDACQHLGIDRSHLYYIRRAWLKAKRKGLPFELHASGENKKRSFEPEVEAFLHEELQYLTKEAHYYRITEISSILPSSQKRFRMNLTSASIAIASVDSP